MITLWNKNQSELWPSRTLSCPRWFCWDFFLLRMEDFAHSITLRGVEWVHWLFLFPPFCRENVVVTCKIGSFLCSLDNLLQKNVIVFFFGNQISKCAREKLQKFLQHISHSHTYMYFAHLLTFCLTNFEKNTNLSGVVSLWYESWCWFLFAPFWNNQ